MTVGINQKMSVGGTFIIRSTASYGYNILLAVPEFIGAACGLTSADIGYMVQSCFITAGLCDNTSVNIYIKTSGSSRTNGGIYVSNTLQQVLHMDLEQLYGSMLIAGIVVAVLSIPIGNIGVIGKLTKIPLHHHLVFGTLMLIIGTQLAEIAIPG